ncbi:hypothetical protein PMZ80_010410 [Knufia obscura]|uniref:Uncharacterized protein n=2 Tax=Knufia TaxID=430999 RepID=A0AAN8ECD3_9EURO|nr:hypothetical protein PMZ80_010410 [Knufia obscura]KAK5951918.1 hypothetical protein OHC33_007211 [Knufia fluminis]
MAPISRTTLVALTSLALSVLTSATPAKRQAQVDHPRVNAIWTNSDIITADLGGGNQITHGSGFSLTDEAGNEIYHNAYPDGYAPCQSGGHTFTLTGSCFGGVPYQFTCASEFSGNPASCSVGAGEITYTADGNSDTGFYGIYATNDGYCGISFPRALLDGCTPDGDWTVSGA